MYPVVYPDVPGRQGVRTDIRMATADSGAIESVFSLANY
jgi:hypothetical protein